MGNHLIGMEFKGDKYSWCPRGFVPLKLTDPMAQDLLFTYAKRRQKIDAEFSDDLIEALRLKNYPTELLCSFCSRPIKEDCVDYAEVGGEWFDVCFRCNSKLSLLRPKKHSCTCGDEDNCDRHDEVGALA